MCKVICIFTKQALLDSEKMTDREFAIAIGDRQMNVEELVKEFEKSVTESEKYILSVQKGIDS